MYNTESMNMDFMRQAFQKAGGTNPRLQSQFVFLFELEKLKSELRQTLTYSDKEFTRRRRENSAEHSWHTTMLGLILQEYAPEDIDPLRVAKMLLIHDVIEIDAGDTDGYSDEPIADILKREMAGAERIFGLLPPDQMIEYKALWYEFIDGKTADARYARAIDPVHPILANFLSGGRRWKQQGIPYEKVVSTYGHRIEDGAPEVWKVVKQCLDYGRDNGFFPAPKP